MRTRLYFSLDRTTKTRVDFSGPIGLGSTLPPRFLSSYARVRLSTTCIPLSSSTNSCERFSTFAVPTMNTERRWYSWQGAARPGRNLPFRRHGRTFHVSLP